MTFKKKDNFLYCRWRQDADSVSGSALRITNNSFGARGAVKVASRGFSEPIGRGRATQTTARGITRPADSQAGTNPEVRQLQGFQRSNFPPRVSPHVTT